MPLGIDAFSENRTAFCGVSRSAVSVCCVASVTDVSASPLFSSNVGAVRSSTAVKVTWAVAESLLLAGSMSALMTYPVTFSCGRAGAPNAAEVQKQNASVAPASFKPVDFRRDPMSKVPLLGELRQSLDDEFWT